MKDNPSIVKTLMCVPDITGFTDFIISNDIDIAKEIIPTLLTGILDSNSLSMSVGDIQGDAIFFYKMQDLPNMDNVLRQCIKMHTDFNNRIKVINSLYKEHTNYKPPKKFGLKIVVHSGQACTIDIGGNKKLIGKDVIIPFRLLKNSISLNNYLLITENSPIDNHMFSFLPEEDRAQVEIFHGEDMYEHIGNVAYQYIDLDSINFEDPL